MSKNKSARKSFIVAAIILAITASIFTINYAKTKKNIENFNAVLEKNEEVNFSQVVQTMLNDNKFGTVEERIRFASLSPQKGIIEIKEKMFIAQVNDVYLNAEDYLGKTIKLEGIFKSEQYYDDEEPYRFVLRYGPGCCGTDGNAGFEVRWDENKTQSYPTAESWVSATGVLKLYSEGGNYQYLYLDLYSLDVLSRRGEETVFQ